MRVGQGTTGDEARRALALMRRLARPATSLFDMLDAQDARLASRNAMDLLLGPLDVSETLARLLASRSGATSARPRPRAVAPDPSPRRPSLKDAAGTGRDVTRERLRDPHLPEAPARRRPAQAGEATTPTTGGTVAETPQGLDRPAGAPPQDPVRTPRTLRDIADIRSAQRRERSAMAPLPAADPARAAGDPDAPPVRSSRRTDAPSPSRPTGTHALVTLARERAAAGMTLPLQALPRSASAAGDMPDQASRHEHAQTGAMQETWPDSASATAATAQSGTTASRSNVIPPDLNLTDPSLRPGPEAPARPSASDESEPSRLGDLAWRNGVEPV